MRKQYPGEAQEIARQLSLSQAEVEDHTSYDAWATAVAEQARERAQREVVARYAGLVHDGADPIAALEDAKDELTSIEDNSQLEEERLEKQRQSVANRLRARINEGAGLISTGIRQIDRELGRFEDYEYTVLAARPGMGKSALARQLMIEFIRVNKQPVQLFSMEMSVDQVIKFTAGTLCGISAKGIEDAFEPQKERFIEQTDTLSGQLGKWINIYDECKDFDDVEHYILTELRKHRPGLIIIDYLQLLQPRRTQGMNREQQIAYMSRRIKNITTTKRVPIVALSQMSREYEKEEREPRKSDLRESGSLEQDADRIWFIHKPKESEPEFGVLPMKLIQAKGRSTGEAVMNVGFERHLTRFRFDRKEDWSDKLAI